jgi:hypothetical protein
VVELAPRLDLRMLAARPTSSAGPVWMTVHPVAAG